MRIRNVFRAGQWSLAAGLVVAGSVAADPKPKDWDPAIDPAHFVSGVDNLYFPLVPGRSMVYQGETRDGSESFTVEVTHRRKTILGVTTMVVVETATLDGETIEISENWFAQDRDGNVWYFGEYSQEFEDGRPVGAPGSWEAGVAGARPGIIMLAHPEEGGSYYQEHAPDVAEDQATVIGVGRTVETPLQTYTGVLLTKEWTRLESGSVEHKYYAPGVGLILEEHGPDRLALVEIR